MSPTYQRTIRQAGFRPLALCVVAGAILLAALLPTVAHARTGAAPRARDTSAHSAHRARGSTAGATLVIEGAGFGHGVGMSQWGALGYAEHGWSAPEILAHYYTGTTLGHVSPHRIVKVLAGGKVKRVPLEAYVRGVVAAEMPSSWPQAALEAQAIASRTYAITDDAGGTKFDVYSDTRSQVYRGKAAETPATNAAVKATEGQVVTYEGQPAITYFFSSSGGRTEDVQNAFPGAAPEPWLRGVADPYEQSPMRSWTIQMRFAAVARRLKGLVQGAFEGIEVRRRGYSPRIISAYVLGSAGNTEVSGAELEGRLGLYASWAYFSVMRGGKLHHEPDLSGEASEVEAPPPASSGSGPMTEAPTGDASRRSGAVNDASGGMRAP